jgi:hypothetical protein
MLKGYGGVPLQCRDTTTLRHCGTTPLQRYDITERHHDDGATLERHDVAAPKPRSATMARHYECGNL